MIKARHRHVVGCGEGASTRVIKLGSGQWPEVEIVTARDQHLPVQEQRGCMVAPRRTHTLCGRENAATLRCRGCRAREKY